MNMDENKVLENAAMLYGAIPGYLLGDKSKEEVAQLLVALIDSLDDIEYSRSTMLSTATCPGAARSRSSRLSAAST